MRWQMVHYGFRVLLLVGLVWGSAGCHRGAASLDRRDERDPMLQRARAREKANDIDGALEQYQKALDRKPRLARAHLEMGLLYDKYRQDYLQAIYHYQRYIDLRPQAEKRGLIEQLIRQAKIAYAASLPDRPSAAIQMIASLRKENMRLRTQIAQLTADPQAEHAPAPAGGPDVGALAAPQPAPAQPPVDTYRVQRGDTLSRIAAKMYNDPNQWKLIYDANRGSLASPESLRLGQTLIIPAR